MRSLFAFYSRTALVMLFCGTFPLFAQQTSQQSTTIPRYNMADASTKTLSNKILRGIDVVPYIVTSEDSLQSYIQDNAISVWVNAPSVQKQGDTLTAVVKRVLRHDITHTLNKHMVSVDVVKFNTRNDTFSRVASLDKGTSILALNPNPEWEKTALDLDMTALYHYVGYLYEGKQKK